MPQDLRLSMHEAIVNLMDPSTILDDRPKITDATRKRLADKGLQFPIPDGPLTVVMMDEIMHTIAFPICTDLDCICHGLEYERACAESKTSKPRRKRRKTIVSRTYQNRGNLAPVNQGFHLMR